MSKLNIMTWNVDWFRNGKHSGDNDSIYDIYDCSYETCNSIISVVKRFLIKENAIVILQEVPYMRVDKEYHRMVQHDLWEVFSEAFPENEYKIYKKGKQALRYTIAITKETEFEEVDCFEDNNLIIGVKNSFVEIVGVHMPTGFELNDEKDDMWKNVIRYVDDSKDNLILVGDFNVFIGCKEKLTEQRYLELLRHMGNCVSENIMTYGKNSIDKIMLKKGDYFKSCQYQIKPQSRKEYSDHKYLVMELDVESKLN